MTACYTAVMGLVDYAENKILDAFLGTNRSSVFPATVYIALFQTVPNDAGTGGLEVSGGSYARVAAANNSTVWPNASGGTKTNGTTLTFPSATASWGTVNGYGIYDASTAGNLLFWATLAATLTIGSGTTPFFSPSALSITAE